MRCYGRERSTGFWILCAVLVPVGIAAIVFLLGFIVMSLWNWLIPGLIGWHIITFWQAVGLFVLAKILFGGFKGHHHPNRFHDGIHRWHMSPEEREKMKEEWRNRYYTTEKKE